VAEKNSPTADAARTSIDETPPSLSVRRQCELRGLNRSSLYYETAPESQEDLFRAVRSTIPYEDPTMRRVVPLLIVLSLGFAPAPVYRETSEELADRKKLQGTWHLTSTTDGGNPQQDRELRWIVSGNKVTLIDKDGEYPWSFTLSPASRPKAIEMWTSVGGASGALGLKAIYALDGDTLTVSFNWNDWRKRPKDLRGLGKNQLLQVFKRKKP
jgi:uncharacterized protein (TIGR03067 family)